MMWWYHDGPGWAGWVAMTVMMLIFWAILIAGGIAVYRALRHQDRQAGGVTDAMRILDERFARGEIDVEEYSERREVLRERWRA